MSNFKKLILVSMVILLNFMMPGNFIHAGGGGDTTVIQTPSGKLIPVTVGPGGTFINSNGETVDPLGNVIQPALPAGGGSAGTNVVPAAPAVSTTGATSTPTVTPSSPTVAPSTTQSTGSRADRKAARKASRIERRQASQKGSDQMGMPRHGKSRNIEENSQWQRRGSHQNSEYPSSGYMRTREF